MSARARLGALVLLPGLAFGASAQGVRELAFAFVQGDFRAPLTCRVDDTPRQALRRVRIQPGSAQAARPTLRLTFFDLEAPPGTRCTSIAGEPEPNLVGTLQLVWDARTRPDTGELDFRNTLRREGGFEFKVEAGRLRIGEAGAGVGARVVDFAGGVARVEPVAPGSDAARRLAAFRAKRGLVLAVAPPGAAPLAFDLVELPSR